MHISLNWLKDYLEIKDVDIDQISHSLTMAGLEVESIRPLKNQIGDIHLGIVTKIEERSNDEAMYEIESNGKATAIRGPKASIKPGMVLGWKPAKTNKDKYALATLADLDLDVSYKDLIVFEQDYFGDSVPPDLMSVKDFDDVIFTISVTPNRADALSHLGVSRELSALLDLGGRSLMLSPKEMAGPTHEKVAIEIDNADDCPRYACRVLENINVAPSPFWLKLRLYLCGVRPINNVVDVTNYVMLSRGQPLHAFDYDKLYMDNGRKKIIVRRAVAGESLITLDGQKLALSQEDVVIADLKNPLALAGVIGGLDSSVNQKTTTVLLESAYFDAKNVRMASRRHGISTESSYRFERGTDPNGVVDALNYAARLLTEISDAKVCREAIDAYRKRIDPQEVMMRPERAQAVLGIDAKDFDQDLLRRKFLRLGIETVAKRGDAIYFRVPTHRSDIYREIDLIEEAVRMIGFDKVKETTIGTGTEIAGFVDKRTLMVTKKVRQTLLARGFAEAINYAFLSRDLQNWFINDKDQANLIEIKNPLSDRYGVMRLSLMPGLVSNFLHNQRNQEKSIQLFEVGTIFLGNRMGAKPEPQKLFGTLDQDSFAVEKQMISGIIGGRANFSAFDHPSCMLDFYHLKGILTEVLQILGLEDQFPNANVYFEQGALLPYFHPGESSLIVYRGPGESSKTLGQFGKLHPQIAAALDISKDVFVFELDILELANVMPEIAKFKQFSRYPTIERDVAFLVDEKVNVGDILDSIADVDDANKTVLNLRVFDIYRGKNIASGKKSVAVAISLQRDDRTLTDEEADLLVNDYIKIVEKKTGATVR